MVSYEKTLALYVKTAIANLAKALLVPINSISKASTPIFRLIAVKAFLLGQKSRDRRKSKRMKLSAPVKVHIISEEEFEDMPTWPWKKSK